MSAASGVTTVNPMLYVTSSGAEVIVGRSVVISSLLLLNR
jgi:hypothetical protein